MRYLISEDTNILGLFENGDSITIEIYNLDDDTKVVDGASCSEIGSTGIFKYLFSPSQRITDKKEYLWIMTKDESTKQQGKIILGGFPDDILDDVGTKASSDEVQAVKLQTDRMVFTGSDIHALVGEVELPSAIQTQINNIEGEIMGQFIKDILKLLGVNQENSIISIANQTINSKLCPSQILITVYQTKSDLDAQRNPASQYNVAILYDNNGDMMKITTTKQTTNIDVRRALG